SGSRDGTVQLWEVATGKRIGQREGDGDWREAVEGVLFSLDGKSLASTWSRGTVILWEVPTWRIRIKIENQPVYPRATRLAFSLDSKTLAISGESGIWFWDLVRNQPSKVATYSRTRKIPLARKKMGNEPSKAVTQYERVTEHARVRALAYTPQGKPLLACLIQ